MLVLRSLAFNVVFYVNLIVQMIFWTPYYFLSPRHQRLVRAEILGAHQPVAAWRRSPARRARSPASRTCREGSFILAPKHQSFWDAIAFFPYLRDPLYILKRELTWIPVLRLVHHEDADDPGQPRQPLEGAEAGGGGDQGARWRATTAS